MRPLCKKLYFHKIVGIVLVLFLAYLDAMFVDYNWMILVVICTVTIAVMALDVLYWIFQPNVLIYQYDSGIVIKRNVQIEYTAIERVSLKYDIYKRRRRPYYKDPWGGTVLIKLKSGKVHKIRNAAYPLEVVGVLSKIKKQKKFR